jgi:dihydroneopterin aldolase
VAVQEPVPPLGWSLNQRELENLLRALHSDPEAASHAYEALRLRLIQFFGWNHVEMPEALADRALDRLARRFDSA